MRMSFRFRWIPFVATVVVVSIGISLGQWQTRRAAEKEAMERTLVKRESSQAVALDDVLAAHDTTEYRHVLLRGQFIREWPIYLDNRSHNGIAGFYVLMPFQLALSKRIVLVARGWVARDQTNRVQLPVLRTPADRVELDGVMVNSVGKVLQLGREETQFEPGAILQTLAPATFSHRSKLPVEPFFIQQRNNIDDGLIRDWPRPALDIERNRGYVVTWYSLALMAAIFYLVSGFKRDDKLNA